MSSILKQPNPSPAQVPSNPGHLPENPFVGLLGECAEAAAKRGGSPQEVATSAIACFLLKVTDAITAPAMENPNPGPAGGETKEPATS